MNRCFSEMLVLSANMTQTMPVRESAHFGSKRQCDGQPKIADASIPEIQELLEAIWNDRRGFILVFTIHY